MKAAGKEQYMVIMQIAHGAAFERRFYLQLPCAKTASGRGY
jgi:hypothetical protein